jgi:hypothetical protein
MGQTMPFMLVFPICPLCQWLSPVRVQVVQVVQVVETRRRQRMGLVVLCMVQQVVVLPGLELDETEKHWMYHFHVDKPRVNWNWINLNGTLSKHQQ